MNQHQILYSKEMILAKLAGRKTVTRRPVKPQPSQKIKDWRYNIGRGKWNGYGDKSYEQCWIKCPYGQSRDRLWTKENFRIEEVQASAQEVGVYYPADQYRLPVQLTNEEWKKIGQWKYLHRDKSKLFMFRSLSRFLDEITEIGVERVQDITEEEALAEGIYLDDELKKYAAGPDAFCLANSPKRSFKLLWQSMYKGDEYDYHNNPWVWVIRYRPLAVNEPNNQQFKKSITQ